jgi:hypothetical protein
MEKVWSLKCQAKDFVSNSGGSESPQKSLNMEVTWVEWSFGKRRLGEVYGVV